MVSVLSLLAQVADTNCTVLITGDSGTGKELVARSLVAGSSRAKKPFVAVNCAAIPVNLVESELFGHARGAFTGATSSRVGRFAEADGGTILLDEIGEMELGGAGQAAAPHPGWRLAPGGRRNRSKIDVRILAATNRKLDSDVATGRFRADLFWRLNVIPIEVPPLRHRASDIPLLCDYFIRRFNEKNRRSVLGLQPEAMAALKRYPWPGNIRELENLLERLVILKGSGTIATHGSAAQPAPEFAQTRLLAHAHTRLAQRRHRPARDSGVGRGSHDRGGP
jgi:sigma-54 specific flagellar transcriptional regulator A